jgi:hypothetical protein
MALAFWLSQAGMRVDVIARTLQLVRKQGGLSRFLTPETGRTFLALVRTPTGKFKSLTAQRTSLNVVYIQNDWEKLEEMLKEKSLSSALVIDIGFRLYFLSRMPAWDD